MVHKFSTAFPQLFNRVVLACLALTFTGLSPAGASSWQWDRVELDRECRPELVQEYQLWTATLAPQLYGCTVLVCDELGEDCHEEPGTCLFYELSPWSLSWTEPDPGVGPTVATLWDAPAPAVGSVVWINVRAVDAAGNLDNGACPGAGAASSAGLGGGAVP